MDACEPVTPASERGRYAVLAPDWLLRGYADRPAVLYDWRTGEVHTLSAAAGYVARACDGATDFTAPFFLPVHRATLDLLIDKGMAVACARGTALDPRQVLRTAANRHLPFANWAVTGRCNLRCRHCYLDAPEARYGELPTADMFHIIDQLEHAGVQRVHLTGGEPLLRDDLWDLIGELAGRRIGVHQISTNGLLLDDEALGRLSACDVDPIVHFSYDGVGSHDAMRGVDGVDGPTVDAMRRTAAAGFRVTVTSSLDAVTAPGIEGTLELLAGLGATAWHVSAPLEVGRWTGSTTGLSLERQAEVGEAIVRSWDALGRPLLLTVCGMYAGSPGAVEQPRGPLHRCVPEEQHCGALLNDSAYVMPDGTLVPCPRFLGTPIHAAMPSLLEVELGAAWEDPALRELVSVTKARVLEHNPECAACAEFADCGAGCWALAYRQTGDLLARDAGACALWKGGYRPRLFAAAGEAPRRTHMPRRRRRRSSDTTTSRGEGGETMSLNDLTAFFERLQTDAALQEKTRELFGADDREEALCRLAAGEGFDFTVEELRSEQAKPALAGLDDESLKEVVGGIGCDIPGGILFHPAGHPEPMG